MNEYRVEDDLIDDAPALIEILNYMDAEGWELVAAFPFRTKERTEVIRYVFRRGKY